MIENKKKKTNAIQLEEGMIKKGGINSKPSTAPPEPPKGQSPDDSGQDKIIKALKVLSDRIVSHSYYTSIDRITNPIPLKEVQNRRWNDIKEILNRS